MGQTRVAVPAHPCQSRRLPGLTSSGEAVLVSVPKSRKTSELTGSSYWDRHGLPFRHIRVSPEAPGTDIKRRSRAGVCPKKQSNRLK
jgi:hypothetical protein